MKMYAIGILGILCFLLQTPSKAGDENPGDEIFRPLDVFRLEYASDPQISPDGKQVVYVRNFLDIMKDKRRSNLWIVNSDGTDPRPLTSGTQNDFSPRWSANGKKLLYISSSSGTPQIHCRWMDSGQTAKLTNLTSAPANAVWSPDGEWIAFAMTVPEKSEAFAEMPEKPEGAEWSAPPKVIQKLLYRADGEGYLKDEHMQLFSVSAEGGAARQLTSGPYDHVAPVWTPDSKAFLCSANRHPDGDYDPLNSEIYELTLADRKIRALTDRKGPDSQPAISADGKQIAYIGFDDEHKGYQSHHLYIMNRDGTGSKLLAGKLDRDIHSPLWRKDGSGVYFLYEDHGTTRIDFVSIDGKIESLAADLGGEDFGRPYSGGSFTLSDNGTLAFTTTRPAFPAQLGVLTPTAKRIVTRLNENLLGHKTLGQVERIQYKSSHDNREIEGWIVKPPHFDAKKKYPLILEIHGGPYANYGERFSAEIQLYAAAGYVVLYTNPRGSTGYGEEFAQQINGKYPGNDYDDLMSGVDALLAKGYVDKDNLFVTGGSGGGALTAWIVGKSKRFKAAVASKPVINWYSFVLTADEYSFFGPYWFGTHPWEKPEEYLKRSPISLVGNVTTPTMLMTGEVDFRTPMSESEQFYQALRLRKIDTALVRIPGASHNIGARPSQMIAKVAHTLKWFEKYRNLPEAAEKKDAKK
ncbi:S9 family peptidase [Telmatocola sphagniphila]|uniref:S9 family peptidase n=1 Tax=Telmatocola sphagniphila TaxID=1123043 RepID=A0A8E6EUH6_9BACT|nr:S9 family peptidase [Telmatocola sphagniphila]QVL33724.1 S9 family peptidase [Telmatocola sphagniphila]